MALFSSKKSKAEEKKRKDERAVEKAADKAAKKLNKIEAKKQKKIDKATESSNNASLSNKNKPYYSKIERPLSGGSGQCYGCKFELDKLFRQHRDRVPANARRPVVFHDNFQQLRDCAAECRSCRTFERALVKVQSTLEDEQLLELDNTGVAGVTASLVFDGDGEEGSDLLLKIDLKGSTSGTRRAFVSCTRAKRLEYVKTVHIDPNDESVYQQARSWLQTCRDDHDQCRRLFWSGSNPTRLIKILNEDQIQLMDTSSQPKLPYIALSYCWGPSNLPDDEWASIRKGMTWNDTIRRRIEPFGAMELPSTLLDVVRFVYRMGFEYVWVCQHLSTGPCGDSRLGHSC